MLGTELNLPDMCQGLVNRVPITPVVAALAAVEVMANGVLATPKRNRKEHLISSILGFIPDG